MLISYETDDEKSWWKNIGDGRLRRKDVMMKVVGCAGKDKETVRFSAKKKKKTFIHPSFDEM